MGKTIVRAMMTGLESFVQFVTGGRIFVCAVLALLFLPITLSIVTFLAVLLPIWYALHIHLAVGAVIAGAMVVLAYFHYNNGILSKYHYQIEQYSYKQRRFDNEYELVIEKKQHTFSVFILQAVYVFLLSAHIQFFNGVCIRRKLEWNPRIEPAYNEYPHNNLAVYEILTGIAWAWPAYLALGLGVLATLVYFVNTLIFGGAETVVSDIIHGPWLYLAGNFAG